MANELQRVVASTVVRLTRRVEHDEKQRHQQARTELHCRVGPKEDDDGYIDASRLRKIVTKAITDGEIDLNSDEPDIEILDEDEAEEARKFFGVF